MKTLLLITLSALILVSCKKEDLSPNSDASIIFTSRSTVNLTKYQYVYEFLGNRQGFESNGQTTYSRNKGVVYTNKVFTLNTDYFGPFDAKDSIK